MYTHHKFHVFEGAPPPHTSYAVCATPRSGSSLLCELLTLTGLAGAPTEFFDQAQMEMFCSAWNVESFDEYLEALLSKKTSPNGIFGFKAHYGQFAEAFKGRDPISAFPNLRSIYITRSDRITQAVSYAIAMQTDKWAFDHPAPYKEPVFDRDQIKDMIAWIERDMLGWEELFERNQLEPLRLVYEGFVSSMTATVIEVLRYIGIEVADDAPIGPPLLVKQANARSEEWVARFREEAV